MEGGSTLTLPPKKCCQGEQRADLPSPIWLNKAIPQLFTSPARCWASPSTPNLTATRHRRWYKAGQVSTPLPPSVVRAHRELDLYTCPASVWLNKEVRIRAVQYFIFPNHWCQGSPVESWTSNPLHSKENECSVIYQGWSILRFPPHLHEVSRDWWGAEPLSPLELMRLKYVVWGRVSQYSTALFPSL